MIDPVTARYLLVEGDMIAAARIHNQTAGSFFGRFARWLSLAILLGASFVVLPIVLSWDDSPSKRAFLVPSVTIVLFGWFIVWVALIGWKIDLRRRVREVPVVERNLTWTIDDQWLTCGSPLSETRMRWEQIKRIVEAPDGFLIYRSKDLFKPLPNHAFATAESIRRLADLARVNVPNYVVLGECQFPAKPEPTGLDEL